MNDALGVIVHHQLCTVCYCATITLAVQINFVSGQLRREVDLANQSVRPSVCVYLDSLFLPFSPSDLLARGGGRGRERTLY